MPSYRLSVLTCLALALSCPAQVQEGKKYALLVGVKEYDHYKLAPLKYTENDVAELAQLLRPAGFEVSLLTDSEGKKDKGRKPTAENIRAGIKKLLAGKTRRDTVLVGLSGHGLQLQVKQGGNRKDESFFCPADAQVNDPDTLISLAALFDGLGDCGAGLKLLLVDACRNKPKAGVRSLDIDSVPPATKGVAALFSCSAGEVSLETDKLKHGVFFHSVLEGMRGKARNKRGEVTWPGLSSYVIERVKEEVASLDAGAEQTPHEVRNVVGSPVLLRPTSGLEAELAFKRGLDLYEGRGRPIDEPAAIEQFQAAAEKGHMLGQGYLAACYWWDKGGKSDAALARRHAEASAAGVGQLAAAGDAEAQCLLAHLYQSGLGVNKDETEAVRWFRKAAEQGLATGQCNLADAYREGRGVEKDYQVAMRWYRKAAQQNLAFAQHNMGWMYQNGLGVEKDYEESLRWYRKAAQQNLSYAQNNVGWMYWHGYGVRRDYTEALRWFRKAAAQGNTYAETWLGRMYLNGQGVAKDEKEAAAWYGKAAAKYLTSADRGQAWAQYELGRLYLNGLGVEKDQAEALRWYRMAAAQNHAVAQNQLGVMYHDGLGVKRDYQEAARWYRLAAKEGLPMAKRNLGFLYANGQGVSQDYERAARLYRQAAEEGIALAQNDLANLCFDGKGVEKDYAEAVRWYRRAAEQGDATGQYNLGWMYENGGGVTKSDTEAYRWYKKAADQGNQDALKRLKARGWSN